MKVVRISELLPTKRNVKGVGFSSIRPVLASDNMGFSMHKTIIPKGDWRHWHYKNHLEACYCVSGHALLLDLKTGIEYEIKPDTIYILDSHDDHQFKALRKTVLISVFNPPVTGTEIHDAYGSY